MMDVPIHCVVDASVGIKLFVDEEYSEKCHALFAHLGADPDTRFFVPPLFYPECANILWKYARQDECTKAHAKESVARLTALALNRLNAVVLTADALAIALANDISVYDACYVAAARHCRVPLLTADEKLAGKIADAAATVLTIDAVDIPPCTVEE